MDILEQWLRTNRIKNNNDIPLYEIVGKELEANMLCQGTWTKAFAEAEGNDEKAKALYIKLRVAQLPQEIARLRKHKKLETHGCLPDPTVTSDIPNISDMSSTSIPDMSDMENDSFSGTLNDLKQPLEISLIADALGLPNFKVIDLIKAGVIKGVLVDEDWYIEKESLNQLN